MWIVPKLPTVIAPVTFRMSCPFPAAGEVLYELLLQVPVKALEVTVAGPVVPTSIEAKDT